MPHPNLAHTNNLLRRFEPIATVLNDLHDAFSPPFVPVISGAIQSLLVAVQNAKKNKKECTQLVEDIPGIVCAIIHLHITSQTPGTLPPRFLHYVGKLIETLHKIHTFVEAQQDGNRIKHFFQQNEMSRLLKDCRLGLQEAQEVFKIESDLAVFNQISEVQNQTESLHNELLELVSDLSDDTHSDRSSSIYRTALNSSDSFSMLPAKPKIFHGRGSDLEAIVKILKQDSARIAILGAGGIGKSSLAKASLHHPDVIAAYEQCFFVAADSASNDIELAASIAHNIGLTPGKNPAQPVIQYFTQKGPSLLILDNMETPWEPLISRSRVEELLSRLTDIPHLALMITMRGTQRPGKVRWSRPFLLPLKPLTHDAALATFIDIADDVHDSANVNRLLHLTDYMPLAVNLMAHLVDYEGCPTVLTRWETEKTSLISDGWDKHSSLDASIAISLLSPRMSSCPDAKELLRLLAILPDGLSDRELVQSNLPIQNVLRARSTLLSTSLAYTDDKHWLKALVPIREYMQHFHPPTSIQVQALFKHFHSILDMYQKYQGVEGATAISQLTPNLGNIHHVLWQGLNMDNPDLQDSIRCTVLFNSFRRVAGHSRTALMDHIPLILSRLRGQRIHAEFITEVFLSMYHAPISNPELLISETINDFHNFDDPILEARFYRSVGSYYCYCTKDVQTGMAFLQKAVTLARLCGNRAEESSALDRMAWTQYRIGNYLEAQQDGLQAEMLAKVAGNLYLQFGPLRTQASCLRGLGDYTSAISLLCRAKEVLGLCGISGAGQDHIIMFSEAEIHLLKSEYSEARSIHSSILQNTSMEKDPHKHAFALLNIAEIGVIIGETQDLVYQNLEKAKVIFRMVGDQQGIIHCEKILADFSLAQGNLPIARVLLEKCLGLSWGKSSDVIGYCLERLADVRRWSTRDLSWTSTWAMVFVVFGKKCEDKLALHKALCFLGDVFSSNGDNETAYSLFQVALEGFTFMDVHRSRADCMLRLGDVAEKRGDLAKAMGLWQEALPLFERTLQAKDVERINLRLSAVDKNICGLQGFRTSVE